MDWRNFDDPKRIKRVNRPTQSHTFWAKQLASSHGLDTAIRIARKYAVDFFIGYKKEASPNSMKGFYQSALNTLLKLKGTK